MTTPATLPLPPVGPGIVLFIRSVADQHPRIEALISKVLDTCALAMEEVEETLDLKSAPKQALLAALDQHLGLAGDAPAGAPPQA